MNERTEADIIRDARSPEHMLLRAPVQGYVAGIPWPIHLEAYDAYCKRYSPQVALIDLKGRGCRGGFSTGELDMFIPGWRERVGPFAELQQRLTAAERELAELRAHGAEQSNSLPPTFEIAPGFEQSDSPRCVHCGDTRPGHDLRCRRGTEQALCRESL